MGKFLNWLKEKYGANCRNCIFCEKETFDSDSGVKTKYFCRANPPEPIVIVKTIVAGQHTSLIEAHWPEVKPEDWCGRFSIE